MATARTIRIKRAVRDRDGAIRTPSTWMGGARGHPTGGPGGKIASLRTARTPPARCLRDHPGPRIFFWRGILGVAAQSPGIEGAFAH